MTQDIDRQAFEESLKYANWAREGENYANPFVQSAWDGWTAALSHARKEREGKLEIRLCGNGELDEIVGNGTFHLEQMGDNHWWMCFEDSGGDRVDAHLSARGKIKVGFEHFPAAAPTADI